MTKMVHWKNIVGKEFLEEFIKTTRSIVIADKNNQPASVVLNKLPSDVQDKYDMKRNQMRKCGYEDRKDVSTTLWHGWYLAYLDGNEVKFHCTAMKEDREYIELTTFLEWKRMGNVDEEIDRYYEAQKTIKKVANSDYFPHED
jgi:hypothetical protein